MTLDDRRSLVHGRVQRFGMSRSLINYSSLVAERILKGIADNFSELINEENNFCLPILNRSR